MQHGLCINSHSNVLRDTGRLIWNSFSIRTWYHPLIRSAWNWESTMRLWIRFGDVATATSSQILRLCSFHFASKCITNAPDHCDKAAGAGRASSLGLLRALWCILHHFGFFHSDDETSWQRKRHVFNGREAIEEMPCTEECRHLSTVPRVAPKALVWKCLN